MAAIKTITKFLCEEYGIPYDEAILKIYNDENGTCFQMVRDERTDKSQELRSMLENNENNENKVQETDEYDDETFDPEDFIEQVQDLQGNTLYRCLKCHKDYKKCGKSAFAHIKKCIGTSQQ